MNLPFPPCTDLVSLQFNPDSFFLSPILALGNLLPCQGGFLSLIEWNETLKSFMFMRCDLLQFGSGFEAGGEEGMSKGFL